MIKLIRFAVITLTATHPTAEIYMELTFGVRWCGEPFKALSNTVCTLPSILTNSTLDCGSTSTLMCYHVPRLAFDYYTKLSGMSCISITVRPSTGVSPGFSLASHRSTRFASYPSDFTPFQTSPLTMLQAGWFPYDLDITLISPLR
jgi:hypothetical protein